MAVVGEMALFVHGLRRFTEVVDILITKEDLKKVHDGLDGLGYVPPHRHSKHLRDTELGVKIEFLITGEYPGMAKRSRSRFRTQDRSVFNRTVSATLTFKHLLN